jgi:eukaryotic-like serine/threonine-protein kinase
MILGTATYMSPEQAKGKPVDALTDVWAFGCVLYEMLTGRMAFGGETIAEIVAGILKSEPDWSLLPESARHLRPLLGRCLEKAPARRFHHMADLQILLEDSSAVPAGAVTEAVAPVPSRRRERWVWATLVIVLIAAVVASWLSRPA